VNGTTIETSASTTNPRSGFRWRLVSSIVLWGIMLAVVFWLPPTGLYIFMNVVIARAVWEFYRICEAKGLPSFKIWGVVGAVALVSGSWFFYRRHDVVRLSYDFDILILLIFTLWLFVRQFPQKLNPQGIETMAVTLFGLLYVAWLGNFITRINFANPHGRYFVMMLVIVTKFTDMGAYIVGSTMGRHKMIPRISPKKTWEGTAGGIAFAVGGAFLSRWLMPGEMALLTNQHAIVIGLLLGAAAVIGDLAESLIKRQLNVKDSGVILAGHGGLFDRMDSSFWAVAFAYYCTVLILPRLT